MPIEIEHLTHVYMMGSAQEAIALDDISMTIEDGEFLGIIGHTGSGKSTFVQHLNALLQPTSGRIRVDGIDPADKAQRKAVRARVGMVFQYPEYQLFEETVAKDIAFGPRNHGLSEAEIDAKVKAAMASVRLDYDLFAERSPFDLSGGQKRRAAMAGILAMQPPILVLDEPMAGLDPRGRDEMLDIIRDYHAGGRTVIMVSHSMDDIAALATRVAVLSAGKLVMLAPPGEVFAQTDRLRDLHLALPQAAHMAELLRARGFDLPAGIIDIDALAEAILRRWKHAQ